MQNFSDFYNTPCCRVGPQIQTNTNTNTNTMATATELEQKPQRLLLEQNYNGKLFADHFNDITLYSPQYHRGAKVEVMLNGISMGIAKIEAVRHFEFATLRDLLCFLNIGKPLHFQAELLNRQHGEGGVLAPDTMLTHLVCGYVQRNMQNQNDLMNNWWQAKQTTSL